MVGLAGVPDLKVEEGGIKVVDLDDEAGMLAVLAVLAALAPCVSFAGFEADAAAALEREAVGFFLELWCDEAAGVPRPQFEVTVVALLVSLLALCGMAEEDEREAPAGRAEEESDMVSRVQLLVCDKGCERRLRVMTSKVCLDRASGSWLA